MSLVVYEIIPDFVSSLDLSPTFLGTIFFFHLIYFGLLIISFFSSQGVPSGKTDHFVKELLKFLSLVF
jgi:hypothetical protein